MSFEQQLALGHEGEKLVVAYMQARGYGVLPSYDFSGSDGSKAPRLMFAAGGLVTPDLDCAKAGKRVWLEVKTYWNAEPNRRYRCRVHGIKRRHYLDYLAVEDQTGSHVFLGVLELHTETLLLSRLRLLDPVLPCLCRTHPAGQPRRTCQVYFDRETFTHKIPLPVGDLRGRWHPLVLA